MGIFFMVEFYHGELHNLTELEFKDELTAILVCLRFAIMTIFLVGLAKWFTR